MKTRDSIRTNRDEEPLSSAVAGLFRCSSLQGSEMYFANTRLLTSARQSYGKHKKNIYMPNFESYDVFKNVVKISSEKKGFFTPIRNVISSILGQVIDYSVLNLSYFNHLTPNDHFSGRTAPLTYRCCNFFYLFNRYTY